MSYPEALTVFEQLQPGDRVEIVHEVKVGFRKWQSTTAGTVVRTDRRRHGLHNRRNFDDKVYSDMIVLQRESGELTTVTLDEFSDLLIVDRSRREDLDDIRAIEEANKSGVSTNYDDFRKELGLA